MQHIFRYGVVGALALALLTPAATFAETSPEAQKWVDKFIAAYDQGPFSTEYTASLQIPEGDQVVDGTMDGSMTYLDATHLRMELTMVLSGMPGAPAGQAMDMNMLAVSDGELTWTEMHMPAFNMRQVSKISIEDSKKLSGPQGLGGVNPTSLDPVQQLQKMTESLDFTLVKEENGAVHLMAPITEESKSSLGQMTALPGLNRLDLILDASTGFPKSFIMGNEEPMISIQFDEMKRLEKDKVDVELFVYEPPEGVQVMDLGAMARAAQPKTEDQ